ncbi:hypothetical protein IVB25_16615 [Bradyrhizobium sp. 193]|uniref:hypothetical protein n=1 Tax=unclassified Bradyrhizobium TaxID=2631580 RepID=UPI001FF9B48B|nr:MULTISPECIES: hypothetical protein [unclassified Bradyrhizobium]MCK1345036.1 hypothetical protein [Bradyrhizobium sp. CW11]MCK1484290.1 hypothetical protein [Bradyrhizobium sp. 193]MCK1707504.1 hypothetical protein [Bradyrhizobium sp. 146]
MKPICKALRFFSLMFAGLFGAILTTLPIVAWAQAVDFGLNSPGLRLNAPEVGAFGMQIKKQLEGVRQRSQARVAIAPLMDVRKSIFVTDENIMKKLTFAEVMDQLAKQGGDPKTGKLALFQQWWDSQAVAPGKTTGPHCETSLNGFPFICPRLEANEANSDPFTDPNGEQGYSAIAYSNRPDLADPANPVDCGEARVVFARNSGKNSATNRNLIIFEARLPNPKPNLGMDGCFDIQQFWLELSNVNQDERGNRLKDFFLNGITSKGIAPVIHVDHYAAGTGQIRTNQFMNPNGGPFIWTLREFKLQRLQPGLRVVPVTVKTNPDTSLFSGNAPIDLQAAFLARLSEQFDNLRGNGTESSAAAFGLRLSESSDDRFNPFESNEGQELLGSVTKAFSTSSLVGTFIGAKLNELKRPGAPGTALTVPDIVQRIQTQTCAGCHHFSNGQPLGGGAGNWPNSLGPPNLAFVHQSEMIADMDSSPEVNGGKRFGISETLKSDGFLPLRCVAMSRILNVNEASCGFKG